MIQQNLFQKGIVGDTDPSIISNNMWTFPTQNIRIFNFDGQGFIITQVEGNDNYINDRTPESSKNTGFKISDGYIILGTAEYNDIIYIISHNPSNGKGEIGTFPSPDWTKLNPTDIPRKLYIYQPLKNLNNSGRTILRSDAFNFDLQHPIYNEIQLIPSYDSSVDIIWTDNKNNIRIVNSGFKSDYSISDRMILASELDSTISLILQTEGLLSVSFKKIITGSLQYGNYIFFVRYVDADFNKSLFLCESNAVSIFKGTWTSDDVQGSLNVSHSDKGVIFTVSSIDPKYKYVQFGYIRYYSDITQILLWDVKVIDKYFKITSDPMDCTIYGNETVLDFTLEEMIRVNIQERVCKSLQLIDNRLFGANWQLKTANHHYLELLSSMIKIKYKQTATNISTAIVDSGFHTRIRSDATSSGTNLLESFADPFVVYDDMSYFHAETYAFGIVWKWKNNNVSDVYNNLIGYDDYSDGTNTVISNHKGIYRFPHTGTNDRDSGKVSFVNIGTDNDTLIKTGIEYDFSDVYTFLNRTVNADIKIWFEKNIESFAAVRAERNKNLLYQGLTLPGLRTEHYLHATGAVFPTADLDYFPMAHEIAGQSTFYNFSCWDVKDVNLLTDCIDMKRFGFYSLDYMLEKEHSVANEDELYISRLYDVRNYEGITKYMDDRYVLSQNTIWDAPAIIEQTNAQYVNTLNPGGTYLLSPVYNITGKITPPIALSNYNAFCNVANDSSENKLFYYDDPDSPTYINRDLLSPPYLGCQFTIFDPPEEKGNLPFYRKICNVYRLDPCSSDYSGMKIVNFYSDLDNVIYYKISNFISIGNFSVSYKPVFYRGDAFIQRTYFKQRTWTSSTAWCDNRMSPCIPEDYSNIVNIDPWALGVDFHLNENTTIESSRYGHGAMFSIITENTINTGLRCQDAGTTFYPVVGYSLRPPDNGKHPDLWALFPAQPSVSMDGSSCVHVPGIEAFLVNSGYNKILSMTPHFPYNPDIIYSDQECITRIRYSSRFVLGSFINQLRTWDSASYKDYDVRYGPICAIRQIVGLLVSIQQKCINEHTINERETVSASQGDILIGTGDILAERVRRISDYGSEHNSSIKTSTTGMSGGVYGISSMFQTIWRAELHVTNMGRIMVIAKNISEEKQISSIINKYLELKANVLLGNNPDNPLDYSKEGCGLITGYDLKFKEVLFTFMFRINCVLTKQQLEIGEYKYTIAFILNPQTLDNMNRYFNIDDQFYIYYSDSEGTKSKLIQVKEITDTGISWYGYENITGQNVLFIYSRTIIFNEKFDMFIGEYTVSPLIYLNLANNFYSLPVTIVYDTDRLVWQHNIKTRMTNVANSYSTFYGQQYPYKLSFIVNGIDEKNNTNMLNKMFCNMVVESSNEPFDRIEYNTKNQYALHQISGIGYPRPWIDPEYIEDGWRIPVCTQTSDSKDDFDKDSNMRGRWMKVTLTGINAVQVFIKNILSNFTISNS